MEETEMSLRNIKIGKVGRNYNIEAEMMKWMSEERDGYP